MKALDDFVQGLWKMNPIFRLVLGMCPTLAVTNMVVNGLAMGLATTFVLICSGFIVSLIRKLVPKQVRIAVYIVIIATFVTIADFFLAAYFPDIHKVLGLYVPLIVVNCIILGRMEAFASHNPVHRSLSDAFGMGIGFTWALVLLSAIREVLGFGTLVGITVLANPATVMILPAGAFFSLGLIIALMNVIRARGLHIE